MMSTETEWTSSLTKAPGKTYLQIITVYQEIYAVFIWRLLLLKDISAGKKFRNQYPRIKTDIRLLEILAGISTVGKEVTTPGHLPLRHF